MKKKRKEIEKNFTRNATFNTMCDIVDEREAAEAAAVQFNNIIIYHRTRMGK